MNDFSSLCNTKDKEELLKISRYWFRFYRKLVNVIEPEIRYLAHNAQLKFISKFEPDSLQQFITNTPISIDCNSETQGTNEISFQNLVTMPAVLWTSVFDDNPQAKKFAIKVLNYLYPKEKLLDFLILHYETIINYCIYCTFHKVSLSLKLFYSSSLSQSSTHSQVLTDAFELHIINICLNGLSSLINYLLTYYKKALKDIHKAENKEKIKNLEEILERIFIRLNEEFIKFKINRNDNDKMTRKKDGKDYPKNDNECNIWRYNKEIYSGPVRLGLYQVFYSLTKLTTFAYDLFNKDSTSYFYKNYIGSTLWFQHFSDIFYKYTFTMGFCDQSTYVRGLNWILCSHILTNNHIYKPWSKINCNNWLNKTLKQFILNDERISQQIDFGFGKIGIENFPIIFEEFLETATDQFSGLKLVHKNYSTMNMDKKVKLVIYLIQSFASNDDQSKFTIYDIFLDYCFTRINSSNIHYNSDVDLSVELYFNIAYFTLKQCFKNCQQNDLNFKKISDDNVKKMIEKLINNISVCIRSAIDNVAKNNLLPLDSQLFLNNILFTNAIKVYYHSICTSNEYDTDMLNEYYRIFETNLISCYKDIFKLRNDLLLPFLVMSFHKMDHYFSTYYYYLPKKLNYLNVLEISLNNTDNTSTTDTSHQINLFNYCLKNKYYDQILPEEFQQSTISLIDILPSIEDNVIEKINELISTLFKDHDSIENNYKKLYLNLLHLQYILR